MWCVGVGEDVWVGGGVGSAGSGVGALALRTSVKVSSDSLDFVTEFRTNFTLNSHFFSLLFYFTPPSLPLPSPPTSHLLCLQGRLPRAPCCLPHPFPSLPTHIHTPLPLSPPHVTPVVPPRASTSSSTVPKLSSGSKAGERRVVGREEGRLRERERARARERERNRERGEGGGEEERGSVGCKHETE